MQIEDMARLLTSLDVAADVVDAIDDPDIQVCRGWDLADWSYDCIPWGIRFLRHDRRTGTTAAVVVVALPAAQRAALPLACIHTPWPTKLLLLG